MPKIEAESRWSLPKVIDISAELQGKTIDQGEMFKRGFKPHHIHFEELDPEPVGVQPIRMEYELLVGLLGHQDVKSLFSEAKGKLLNVIDDHFKEIGILGVPDLSEISEIPILPRGLVRVQNYTCHPEDILRNFRWEDYRAPVTITSSRVLDRWPANEPLPTIGPFINTTKLEVETELEADSNLFSVDFALVEDVPNREWVTIHDWYKDSIAEIRETSKIRSLDINSFSITEEGQRLMTALLESVR